MNSKFLRKINSQLTIFRPWTKKITTTKITICLAQCSNAVL